MPETPRKAFRVEDVKRHRFYLEHREAILEAMEAGLVLRPGDAVPDGAELVTRDVPTFTRAQLLEPGFYDEHREAILEAVSEGRITA